jgi:hypothetical protein
MIARRASLGTLAALTLTAGLAACGASLPGRRGAETPAWVLQPPQDTTDAYFGIGEGHDQAAARRAALKDIATRMKVVVSGRTTNVTSDFNGQVSRQSATAVTEEVERIEFRHHQIVKSEPSPAGMAVMVRVEKAQFRAETRERIQQLRQSLDVALAGLSERTLLDQYAVLVRSRAGLQALAARYELLGRDQLSADEAAHQTKVRAWLAEAEAIVTRLVIVVAHTTPDAEVAQAVSAYLASQGIRLTRRATEANATLGLSVQERRDELQGSRIVRLTVAMTLSDSAGQVRASYNRVAAGSSMTGHDGARQVALRVLAEDMRKDGVLKVLGLPTQ